MRTMQFNVPTTTRDPSPSVWQGCPWFDIIEGVTPGVAMYDDFTSQNITAATTEGNWAAAMGYAQFSDTGGTITAGTGQGGEAVFASDGDNEGASIRTVQVPFKIARTTGRFWFEARVKPSTITDSKNGFFLGLFENVAFTAIVPIAAAGTLTDNNFVGFHKLEADGDQIDTVYKANGVTQVTLQADALATGQVLVADTYIKLGMRYFPTGDPEGPFRLAFYANGVRLTTSYQMAAADGTDFPNDVGLGFAFAVLNATGTTPGSNTLDWWRAAQLLI